jgi:hypothetical protein
MMSRAMLVTAVILVACMVRFPSQADCQERKPADRGWIVGTWRSYKLDYGDFGEWKGAAQIELVATSPDEIGLFLISADGKRSRAGDSEPGILDDSKLFFGPIGSGLSFRYRRPSDNVLILDLKASGAVIHAELRREKKIGLVRTSRCSRRGRHSGFPRLEAIAAGPAAERGR